MKYRIKNKKDNIYYTSTPFKNYFHWTFDEPYLFRRKLEAQSKIDEIVSIKRLTTDDLIVERVK